MLLTITSTHPPATDLGYLLHKNPERCQSFELPVGRAHVFYPEASGDRCTVAMLLEVDPVGLVRGRGKTLREYINDRPYAASSFLSVAISLVGGDHGPRRRGDGGQAPGLRGQGKARIGAARLKMSGQGVRADHLRPPETWSGSGPGA